MDWYLTQIYPLISQANVAPSASDRKLIRHILILGIMVLLLAVSALLWADVELSLVVDGQPQVINTYSRTVGQLLASEGITLGPHDAVFPQENTRLSKGMQVRVVYAHQVTVQVDGTESTTMATAATVGEALEFCGVKTDADDIVRPAPDTLLRDGQVIRVTRVELRTEQTTIEVPQGLRRTTSSHLAPGLWQVLREGRPGTDVQEWKVTYHDGEPVAREAGRRFTLEAPVDKIVMVGVPDVSRGKSVPECKAVTKMRATAYTYTGFRCATGVEPGPGIVAVDPAVVPLGTELYIEGYGYAKAMDTGGAIKGNRVDVFFTTRDVALQWGVRNVNVYVLG